MNTFQIDDKKYRHISVMPNEFSQFFTNLGSVKLLDCTFGLGGHTKILLDSNPEAKVFAIDQDPFVIPFAEKLKLLYPERFFFNSINFRNLDQIQEDDFAGIFFDLGVSSLQLDMIERGFSFRGDAKTDMRFNPNSNSQTAEMFLENATEDQLIQAIRDFGEERNWKKVVKSILNARGTGILGSTQAFSDLISSVCPRYNRLNPATKTFQGVRIAINDELNALEFGLEKAFEKLKEGGILGVISFHALEDRIVKIFFQKIGRKIPIEERNGLILTKKPLVPKFAEVKSNPRARSAKFRVLKRVKYDENSEINLKKPYKNKKFISQPNDLERTHI